ncbi:MAG: DUF2752 domain-containing protein [Candidatus Korobacteraceae bacterium]|jgi:uncharacterized protein DUF2752
MTANSYIGPKQHLLVLGCLVLGGLLLACAPNVILGMHYQCMLHRITGLRCPFCGMTRDFILMAHGSLPRHNPGSLFVALALYLAYPPWLMMAALRRRSWLTVSREKVVTAAMIVMAMLFIANNLVS